MLRTLFFEFPEDPTSWLIEDEYMFGSDILVAPLMEEVMERNVYMPPGTWIDYQSKAAYRGGQWHKIKAGAIPCVILVKSGAVIPHLALAQTTQDMDWSKIELRVYGSAHEADGLLCLPKDNVLRKLVLEKHGGTWEIQKSLLPKAAYTIKEA
jgi:alpha-D-xyloside xylohydrolase